MRFVCCFLISQVIPFDDSFQTTANQETIVELLGFARRVFPKRKTSTIVLPPPNEQQSSSTTFEMPPDAGSEPFSPIGGGTALVRTEITFDFHRLNVLVLRALMRDQFLLGRKVGTFTMSEARIHATLNGPSAVTVEGSLGGLQVLDLTPEGVAHQRILSVGKDPLTDPPPSHVEPPDLLSSLTQEIYAMGNHHHVQATSMSSKNVRSFGGSGFYASSSAAAVEHNDGMHEERQALAFRVSRSPDGCVDIRIRMASVWYTHCARFVQELSWCATEFKHYLKNVARSIRDKATDMALGLVQLQLQRNAAELQMVDTMETPPRKSTRQRLTSFSASGFAKPQGGGAGCVGGPSFATVDIRLDIVLDTPVLVMPRSSCSPHVFVAHLGKITVTNVPMLDSESDAATDVADAGDSPTSMEQQKPAESPPKRESMFTIGEELHDSVFSIDMDTSTPTNGSDTAAYRVRQDFLPAFDESVPPAGDVNLETYTIDVRNMNLFSLDTSTRKGFRM